MSDHFDDCHKHLSEHAITASCKCACNCAASAAESPPAMAVMMAEVFARRSGSKGRSSTGHIGTIIAVIRKAIYAIVVLSYSSRPVPHLQTTRDASPSFAASTEKRAADEKSYDEMIAEKHEVI